MDLIERLHRTHRLTSILATHNSVLASAVTAYCDWNMGLQSPRGIPTGPFIGY
jgi:hypothetical protein